MILADEEFVVRLWTLKTVEGFQSLLSKAFNL